MPFNLLKAAWSCSVLLEGRGVSDKTTVITTAQLAPFFCSVFFHQGVVSGGGDQYIGGTGRCWQVGPRDYL